MKTTASNTYRAAISIALGGKSYYQGTVPAAEKAKRRAKSKAARKARKAAR